MGNWLPAPFLFLLLLAGCGAAGGGANGDGNKAGERQGASASALERAAIKAGVVTDADALSPLGLYRKRHEAGVDSLCIVPEDEGRMHFALEAAFGEGVECRGEGNARLSGDKLVLNFARSACLVVATYEGDRIAMPGAMDVECSRLCSSRGSLEGVTFPRVSRDPAVARDARGRTGDRLCS